jgi:iron complex outermembrane recepter protein
VEGKIFAGFDNLLDQTYSLGNDTNAFGNRFYNIAPDRTFNSGVSLSYHF